MLEIIKYEIIKTFRLISIRIGLALTVALSIIFFIMKKGDSAFFVPINILNNMGTCFILVLLISFCTYVYGVEIDNKTLKILKAKQVREWKFILCKYIVSIIYSFIVLALVFAVTIAIGLFFFPIKDVYLDFAKFSIHSNYALSFTIKLFLLQAIADIFIVSVCLIGVIISDSPSQSFIVSFLVIVGLRILSNITKWGAAWVDYILPFNSNSFANFVIMNNNMNSAYYKLGLYVFYSILLFIISIFVYKGKDVK